MGHGQRASFGIQTERDSELLDRQPSPRPWHSWLLLWAPGARATLSILWISMQALAFCRNGELGYHEMQIHLRKKNQLFFSEVQLMKVSGKFISPGRCNSSAFTFMLSLNVCGMGWSLTWAILFSPWHFSPNRKFTQPGSFIILAWNHPLHLEVDVQGSSSTSMALN